MLDFKNKKITIMGLGLHGGGLAIAKFLAQQGAILTVTDLKSAAQLAQPLKQLKKYKIRYVLGRHVLADFIKADMVIKNPGVHGDNKFLKAAQAHQVQIETDLSLFFQLCPSKHIISITGTKGKSTTTSLIYQIVKAWKKEAIIGGNIRISPLDYLAKIKRDTPVILELSSWQLEGLAEQKTSPHLAVITNVLADHLNTYKSMAEYAKAKFFIIKFQKSGDIAILNKDNKYTRQMAVKTKAKIFWFSLKPLAKNETGAYLKNDWLVFKGKNKEQRILTIKDIKLQGEHNIANVLAAICLAKVYGVPDSIIINVVKSFKGIEGRLQLVAQNKGISYYNDTTATAPDATVAALNSFKQKIVLLAGGTDKKLEFKVMAQAIKDKVRTLILFNGTATIKLRAELKKIKFQQKIIIVNSMAEAFKQAKKILKPGDIFLLSPGAASFGIFINEFDRGAQFNREVAKIINRKI